MYFPIFKKIIHVFNMWDGEEDIKCKTIEKFN